MSSAPCGPSHHTGCACREAEWQRQLDAEREMRAGAEARAERLEAALREIDARTGHFGEAPPPPEWMPMLSLIAWVGRTTRAALARRGEGEKVHTDIWRACGCPDPDDCEHVFRDPAPGAEAKP